LSKESVTNATTGKGPSTNSNAHDKQTAAIPDAEKSPGQEYNKEVSQLGRETFRKGEVALETVAKETLFAVMFGGVGRLATGLATNLGRFAGKLAGVFRGERKVAGATDAAAKGAGNIPLGFWRDYPKVTVNGREYAQVGDRLYTQHAVDRMTPSGLGTAAGAKAGDGVGRSISPNSVEAVITSGNRADVEVKGVMRSIYTSGSVEVVTEGAGKVVITVNPFKY
jgi:hypothetical protein